MYKKLHLILGLGAFLFLQAACSSAPPADDAAVQSTPIVTVAKPVTHSFRNSVTFNATTQYQQKSVIRAGLTGYLHHRGWKTGDRVKAGEVFCTITSKEQEALKNIDQTGILEKFRAPIKVIAGSSGIITAVNFQNGDYVSEGDVVANLVQTSSLVLLVSVPVEYLNRVKAGSTCVILMPDGKQVNSRLQSGLPTADPAVQTQSFIVNLGANNLPEGANLKVMVPLSSAEQGMAVPVDAVQTDETQEHFWVFKLGKDNRAYKVEVKAGKISPDSLQEIQSSQLGVNDQVIVSGAYGLTDSSKVAPQPPKGGVSSSTP
ncbi:efflux RND transporter periplasmic adaptor subunit [Mucilaginibacter paludis]|uniref:Efflux transporter, RND family, MFP subunit n=1 Tax=Mucilaginibacter paludis DSM 18603 TaxID=714943 RepID=H1Y0R6_9SPHI|nr:efflux RND transporter periplasmic adaptor subunit [Mucilaginibacter paludis]EHQ28806.1 efflux transporter, RND family, MFP subunit [Mucilaginibacter paludis DSM 18603]